MKNISLTFYLIILAIGGYAQDNDIKIMGLKGKVKSVKYYTNDKLTRLIEFNKNGLFQYYVDYCNDNKIVICNEILYQYDSIGRLQKMKNEFTTHFYEYDDLANLRQETLLKSTTRDTIKRYEYYFDSKNKTGYRVSEYINRKYLTIDSVTYAYDMDNKLINEIHCQIRFSGTGNLMKKTQCKESNYLYNENGEIEYEEILDEFGLVAKRREWPDMKKIREKSKKTLDEINEYDKYGNLIKMQKKNKEGKVTSIYTRVIDYYE